MENNLPKLSIDNLQKMGETLTGEQASIIINRWVNQIGIASQFKNERNLSIAFEYVSTILLVSGSKNKYNSTIEVIIYPIIRRIFENITNENDLDVKIIKEYIDDIYEKLNNFDFEAEMCALFSENFTLKSQTFVVGEKVLLPKLTVDSPWSDVEVEVVDVVDYKLEPNTLKVVKNLYSVKIKDSEFPRDAFGKDLIKL